MIQKHRTVVRRKELFTLLLLAAAVAAAGIGISAAVPRVLRSVTIHDDFQKADLSLWEFPYPEDWQVSEEGGNRFLHMLRNREPGVPRRPLQFARMRDVNVGSFELRARVRREGRSMIVVFNYVDTLHFYYTHLSVDRGTEQPVHNGIFIVNGEPRKRIAGTEAAPALPDRGWHDVRVVRNVSAGSIEVFMDEGREPLFSVTDTTFTCGQIGVGSFDEAGDFDDIYLESNDAGCVPGSKLRPASADQARGASN